MSGGETSGDEIVEPKPQTKQQIDINNPYSPYYLSNSDHTGYIISPVTLTGQNYGTWSRLVINGLKSKNKLGFVNGKITRPEKDSPEEDAWEKCNSMVTGWLYNVIDKGILRLITYAGTAYDIWTDLEERYSQSSAIGIHQLKREITQGVSLSPTTLPN